MDYLKLFAEDYGLKQIINQVVEYPNVQGAVLTLDDWWLTAWKFKESGRQEELAYLLRQYYSGRGFDLAFYQINNLPWFPRRRPDLNWRPPYWDSYSYGKTDDRNNDILPVRLIVCLKPPSSNGVNMQIPDLPNVRLPVSFEVRPLARLSMFQSDHRTKVRPVIGGVSVGTGSDVYGTLGGIVKDENDIRYGMTCAHVFPSETLIEQPAQYDDVHTANIGKNTSSITLDCCPRTGPCNPYISHPHITSVDTTLVELESNSDFKILSIGSLAGVISKSTMSTGQEIMFAGRTSGNRIAQIGGLAVFYQFNMKDKTYCFRDLFEIRWNSFARMLLGSVVKEGDSGAWICAETDQGPAWCGQVIGEDRGIGYATFAENTIEAWRNKGKKLRVTL